MQQVIIEGTEYVCPEIEILETDKERTVFKILEGDYNGKMFALSNLRVSAEDASLLEYDLQVQAPGDEELLKSIADSFLVITLHNQYQKHENPPPE